MSDMLLTSSGQGWCGTFAIVVRTAVEDILSDGAPFSAVIEHETEVGDLQVGTHQIESVDGDQITTTEKIVIPLDSVRRLEA
jgi:hypothetical protein